MIGSASIVVLLSALLLLLILLTIHFFFLLLFCFCLMASIHSGFRFHPVRSSVWFNFIFTLHFVLRLFLPLHLFRIVHSPFSFVLLKTCFFFLLLFLFVCIVARSHSNYTLAPSLFFFARTHTHTNVLVKRCGEERTAHTQNWSKRVRCHRLATSATMSTALARATQKHTHARARH